MLQRIAAVLITLVGVALALVVGFWVLVILGAVALIASLIYFVRAHVLNDIRQSPRDNSGNGNVIEGEYTVVDEEKDRDEKH